MLALMVLFTVARESGSSSGWPKERADRRRRAAHGCTARARSRRPPKWPALDPLDLGVSPGHRLPSTYRPADTAASVHQPHGNAGAAKY